MARLRGILTILLILILSGVFQAIMPLKAIAVDTSAAGFINNQNYNQLVSDADFTATGSMNVGDIQNFLASQGSGLATIGSSSLGSGANGRGAAQIIYDAAHAADSASSGCAQGICLDTSTGTVSPKVILITLQKEEGLISAGSPSQGALDIAMGYGCPDSGGCNPTYQGFTNQVGWASWQLRWNFEMSKAGKSGVAPYIVGGTLSNYTYNVPDQGISGSVTVSLSNNATSSLYRYTPHLFYGNYNFWKMGINWFGFSTSSSQTSGGSNDTSSFSAGTYSATFKASGTKASDSTVVYNGATIANMGATTWSVSIAADIGTHDYVINYIGGSAPGSKTITIDRRRIGDINNDGKVNALDLSTMFNSWGQTVRGDNWVNLNPDVDGVINILDMSLMFNNWTG